MTLSEFQSNVLERSFKIPVVADFWASWCDPCLLLDPYLTEIAQENSGKWELVKIDTEQSEEVANAYFIRGVPALRVFINGEIKASFNGLLFKKEMAEWLSENTQIDSK